ncbi:hypothetical protein Ae201684P_004926 [Aphanomyces euteiches]|uniref:Uncharacterized protein n=1 Tax=Aphanomyces euteiches TaxID=100861 RepID=A0A6G0WKD8_9STRA|nr:hypothetical protein Ae201684_014322 [Aphanomyces euteiches]KAH9069237.1 hypothetical protein Ae201684P_004926 [Aphanomyces euteiches]
MDEKSPRTTHGCAALSCTTSTVRTICWEPALTSRDIHVRAFADFSTCLDIFSVQVLKFCALLSTLKLWKRQKRLQMSHDDRLRASFLASFPGCLDASAVPSVVLELTHVVSFKCGKVLLD